MCILNTNLYREVFIILEVLVVPLLEYKSQVQIYKKKYLCGHIKVCAKYDYRVYTNLRKLKGCVADAVFALVPKGW